MWRRTRHFLEYLALRCAACIVQAVPFRVSVRGCEWFAWFVTFVLPRRLTRYDVARENLERAFGPLNDDEVDRLVHGMWCHFTRMFVESLQAPRRVRLENSRDVIDFRDRDAMTRALSTGRPVIMLTGHFGNWELANRALGVYGFPMAIVARTLDNPYLEAWARRVRLNDGHTLIPKVYGGDAIVAALADGRTVGLLCDQDAGEKGMFVPFFGRPASTHKSIAVLALEFDAIIVVTATRRLPDRPNDPWSRFEISCEEVIDTAEHADDPEASRRITERYTLALERAVRRAPEQYFWVHRRWKSRPYRRRERQRHVAFA